MNNNELISQVEAHLCSHHRLLVALSGGLDSCVLLHILVQLRERSNIQLRAIYIHHGLSPNADNWARHCDKLCKTWKVDFRVVKVKVEPDGEGIEAGARRARYQALAECLNEGEALLTAQHLDDQCETFMLALKRGSGPAGLAAMPQFSLFASGVHLRPLLEIPRSALEQYAQVEHIQWVEDESNHQQTYDRNFLRHAILPPLKVRWPGFSQAVARSARLCGEQEALLDELLYDVLMQALDEEKALSIESLKQMSEIKRFALLRRWFTLHQAVMPGRELMTRLWYEVALAKEDGEPRLYAGNKQVRRFRQRLYLLPLFEDLQHHCLEWKGGEILFLPDNLGYLTDRELSPDAMIISVRMPTLSERVTVRFQATGRFCLAGKTHSRPLKKIWQEKQVAPWKRQRTPLLFYNDTLIAALGIFITREGISEDQISEWNIRWIKK